MSKDALLKFQEQLASHNEQQALVAALLQAMDATVTVCHSRTADMPAKVRRCGSAMDLAYGAT